MRWIVEDVLPDRVQGFVVADDVLVVIALPDAVDIRMGSKPFGDADLETANDRTDGSGWRPQGRRIL